MSRDAGNAGVLIGWKDSPIVRKVTRRDAAQRHPCVVLRGFKRTKSHTKNDSGQLIGTTCSAGSWGVANVAFVPVDFHLLPTPQTLSNVFVRSTVIDWKAGSTFASSSLQRPLKGASDSALHHHEPRTSAWSGCRANQRRRTTAIRAILSRISPVLLGRRRAGIFHHVFPLEAGVPVETVLRGDGGLVAVDVPAGDFVLEEEDVDRGHDG